MFVITKDRTLDIATVDAEIDRLLRLVADLKAIRTGNAPAEADLRSAPVLDHWIPAQRAVPCLIGKVSGHPRLPGTGRPIATSDLWVLAEQHGWARTLSRWYRLGRPRGRDGLDA